MFAGLRAVLGLRRIRRTEPRSTRDAVTQQPQAEVDPPRQDSSQGRRATHKRRSVDETARYGQSKLGRAAHLRPGRITLGQVYSAIKKAQPQEEHVDAATLRPPSTPLSCRADDEVDEKGLNSGPCAPASDGQTSWRSEEHSVHSNMQHHQARLTTSGRADPPPMPAGAQLMPETSAERHGDAGPLFDDFYRRNPAALANGWLALSHHRELPPGRARSSAAIDNIVQCLIQPNQPQLVGLFPKFSSRTKRRRRSSSHA